MRFLFVLDLFLFFQPAYAQIFENQSPPAFLSDFHLAVEPTISYTNGFLGEILYRSVPKDKKISLLEWDRNIFLFGANLHTSYKNLHLDFGAASSLFNQTSGEMQDSDWLNESDYFMKTTYSVGENKAVENWQADFQVYYDFKTTSYLTFSPIFSVRYSYDSFERSEAEGWYGQSDRSSDKKNHWWYETEAAHYPETYWSEEKGRYVTRRLAGIDYFRKSLITFLGFNAKIKALKNLTFDFTMLLSPFSHFYAIDSHHAIDSSTGEWYEKHLRMIQFSYFNILSLGAGANFSLNRIFTLSLKTNYLFTLELGRGTLYSDNFGGCRQDDYYNTGQDSGLSIENFTTTLGLKIKIF